MMASGRASNAHNIQDEDGFTLVTKKRGKNRTTSRSKGRLPSTAIRGSDEADSGQDDAVNVAGPSPEALASFLSRHRALKSKLARTPLFSSVLANCPDFASAICYGLGSLKVLRSQLQLAVLCQVLDQRDGATSSCPVHCYDPCHTEHDKAILRAVGFQIIEENDQGHRDIGGGHEKVLFYMPHCDRWLYCNVLEKQQSNLDRIILLGNSFQEYSKRSADDDWVSRAVSQSTEINFSLKPGEDSLLDESTMFEAFNDMRLILFRETQDSAT